MTEMEQNEYREFIKVKNEEIRGLIFPIVTVEDFDKVKFVTSEYMDGLSEILDEVTLQCEKISGIPFEKTRAANQSLQKAVNNFRRKKSKKKKRQKHG